MKIAILTASFLPKVGGAQVFSYNIAHQFTAEGHQVTVYVPAENYKALDERFRGLLYPLPRRFYGLVRRIPILGLYLAQRFLLLQQRKENFDVWLVIATFPSGYVATCLQGQTPIILRASGEDIQKDPILNYGYRLDSKKEANIASTVKKYDRLVALTKSVRTDFLELGVPNNIVSTIPNGVDINRFKRTKKRSQLRSHLEWPTDRPVILTTGRNHRKKGYDQIPEIAEYLKNQGLIYQWYVVGMGSEKIDIELQRRELQDCVKTLPEIGIDLSQKNEWEFPNSQLVAMYQAADIYAFPSLLETFGMVQLEAMAAGAAVISTDAPGCRDVVTHEFNGLSARAGDAQSFAEQLGRALKDEELRERLSKNALTFIEEYGWSQIAKSYEALFCTVIGKDNLN